MNVHYVVTVHICEQDIPARLLDNVTHNGMCNLEQRVAASDQEVQFQDSWSDDIETARQSQNEARIA